MWAEVLSLVQELLGLRIVTVVGPFLVASMFSGTDMGLRSTSWMDFSWQSSPDCSHCWCQGSIFFDSALCEQASFLKWPSVAYPLWGDVSGCHLIIPSATLTDIRWWQCKCTGRKSHVWCFLSICPSSRQWKNLCSTNNGTIVTVIIEFSTVTHCMTMLLKRVLWLQQNITWERVKDSFGLLTLNHKIFFHKLLGIKVIWLNRKYIHCIGL